MPCARCRCAESRSDSGRSGRARSWCGHVSKAQPCASNRVPLACAAMELSTGATRPRNVDWKRAAALLYGDWGTSKAYVLGIAFAIAMYSSFWYVLSIGVLTAIVGINYIWICKYFPDGGGVYSSAKAQHRYLALIGGF